MCVRSEDYYGDLDLKAIRKSELLSGLDNKSSKQSSAETKAAAPKPQPQRQQQQQQQQQSNGRPQPQQQQQQLRTQPQQQLPSQQSSKDYDDA